MPCYAGWSKNSRASGIAIYFSVYSKQKINMSDYFSEYDEIMENKLGIDDPQLLRQAESEIVFVRLAELLHMPLQGAFDFEHLRAIHKHLFSDIYDMAGQIRTVSIAKGYSVFCYPENIDVMQREIFDRLKGDRYLRGLGEKEFAQKLAELSGNLNALHPLREGNGRAIRCFLVQLSREAGYSLRFEELDTDAVLRADVAAFNGDSTPLAALYEANL